MLCLSRLEETVNDADFIFEAVKEDLEIKKDLLESKCGIPKKQHSFYSCLESFLLLFDCILDWKMITWKY